MVFINPSFPLTAKTSNYLHNYNVEDCFFLDELTDLDEDLTATELYFKYFGNRPNK